MKSDTSDIEPIPSLSYDDFSKDHLCIVQDLVVKSMKERGPAIETGYYPIDGLSPEVERTYELFMLAANVNETIDGLNIIIADLQALSRLLPILSGDPLVRLRLLFRQFFVEVHRTKDFSRSSLGRLLKKGYISRDDHSQFIEVYYEIFKNIIDMRNSLIHGEVRFRGREWHDVALVCGAASLKHVLVDKTTGNVLYQEDAIADLTRLWVGEFRTMGVTLQRLYLGCLAYLLNGETT